MPVADRMREKLSERFRPSRLDIIDESHRHEGHPGARPGGETHFMIAITAAEFAGLGRVARQRRVYEALAEELAGPVHALSLDVRAPGEE